MSCISCLAGHRWKKLLVPVLILAVVISLLTVLPAMADVVYDTEKLGTFNGTGTALASDDSFHITGLDGNGSNLVGVDTSGIYLMDSGDFSQAESGVIDIKSSVGGRLYRMLSISVGVNYQPGESIPFTFKITCGTSPTIVKNITVDSNDSSTYDRLGVDTTYGSTWAYKTIVLDDPQLTDAVHVAIRSNGGNYRGVGYNTSVSGFTVGSLPGYPPTVTTADVTTYTAVTAEMGGNVTADGGDSVTERGVVYSAADNTPEIGEPGVTKDSNGTGTGSFSETVSGLTPGTTYYVRAYATNSVDTAYGTIVSFKVNDTYVISLNPGTDHTFPAATVGYGAQTARSVTINSTGTGATGPLAVALGGANAGDFELSTTSITSIAAGGNSVFTVVPKTGLVAGNYTATVTVSGGSVLSQSFNISFTVNDTYVISLNPGTDHTFPAVNVGYAAQTARSVTINSTGTGATDPLTVALGGANAGDFELSTTSIASIAAGGSSGFTVAPKTGLVAGNYTATVTVSGVRVVSRSFNVSFTVNDTYIISLDPGTDQTFPAADVGYAAQTARSVTINSTGTGATGPLTVALGGTNAGDFELSTTSIVSIAAGGNSSFTIAPKTGLVAGNYSATVTVSGARVVSRNFNVSFTVNDTYIISLDPGTDHTFPAANVGYAAQTARSVTINSTGTGATGPLTVALGGTNAGDFELSTTSIASIAAGGNSVFTVVPKTGLVAGNYTATVTVSGDSVVSRSFNVSFTVNDTYVISLNPGTDHTFPAANVGYAAQTARSVTINSTGTGATGPLTVALSGANAGDFELSTTSIASIAAGGSSGFTVVPKSGLVAGNYTATVTVSGVRVVSRSFNVSFTVNDTYVISLNPGTDHTFPAADVGYAAQTARSVTINSTGTGATGPLTVALSGANAGDFELSTTSIASIAAGGNSVFTVAPKTGLVAGNYTATVTVSGVRVVSRSFNVSFTVNDTYVISLNPGTDHTFPAVDVGYAAQTARSVTINSTGTGVTGALTVALGGPNAGDFELSATSITSIAGGGSSGFTVAPKTGLVAGNYTATVTVSGVRVVSRSFNVSFTVNDTFGISLDPGTDYTFPAVIVGYEAQTAHTVTVNNEGTGATGALAVALSGANSAAFELSALSISSIVASSSDSFTVAPKTGLVAGNYTATVTVSGASVDSQSFNVSFTVNDTYGISLDPGTDYIFPAADVGYGIQAAYTVTVNNAGSGATGPLTVALGGTNPAAFELSEASISSIAALGSDSFTLVPKTGLLSGTYTATVTVSGISVASESIDISFTVNDTYGISLDPGTDYTFPEAYVGYGAQDAHTVTVNSTGTGATGALAVALTGANPTAFELSETSISSIAASGSDSFSVAPKTGLASGNYTATVTVSGDSAVSQSFNISFTVNDTFGIFLNPGTQDTFPEALAGYGAQTAHTITIFNGGSGATGPLTVALGGTNPAAFEISATSISSIAALGSDSFTLVPKTGLLSGTYTATVTVSGISVASRSIDISFTVNDTYGISLDPGTDYIFPAADVGYGIQAAYTVTVNNEGTGATGPLTVALGGINPAAFELSAASISSIAASGSDSFTVAPKTGLASGIYTATVTVSGGSVASRSFDVSFSVGDTFGISLDPGTDHTFPAAYVGYGVQAAHTVTVNNTGTGATGPLTVVLGGTNPTAFELSATSISSIAALGSGSFSVSPRTGLASGTYAATVTVSGGSVASRSFNISFIVNDTYGVMLDPDADHAFQPATVGYGAQTAHTVTVNNTGTGATGPLTVTLGGMNPGDFELSKTVIASLAAMGSGSFTVAPKTGLAEGSYAATVTVSGGSVTSQSFSVSFTVNPSYGIALSPAADYIFPEATEGYEAQTAYDVTVSNTGTGFTGILTASLGGVNPDAFTLTKASFSSLAPLGSDSFAITPRTGLAAGNYSAMVTVSGGFSIAPQSLNVSFKVNYVMSEGVLEEQTDSATIIAEGLFAKEAQLIVVPIAEGDTDRTELEEQLTEQNAIAAYEVHVEPAEAFRPPLTLTFAVGQSFNGRTVYILHKLSNGSTDIYTPTVANGEAVITVNELSPFLLAVDPAVIITLQPQSALALVNQTATFHVEAMGLVPLTYQWQRRTSLNAAWEDISGAAGPGYTTTSLNMSHNGYQYRVIVTDVLGNSVTSDAAVLTVTASPDTGDDSQPLVYVILTALFGMAVIILLRKRRMA